MRCPQWQILPCVQEVEWWVCIHPTSLWDLRYWQDVIWWLQQPAAQMALSLLYRCHADAHSRIFTLVLVLGDIFLQSYIPILQTGGAWCPNNHAISVSVIVLKLFGTVSYTVTQKTVWMFCRARLCWQFLHEFLSINHEKIITRKPCFLAFSWYHVILVMISFHGNISIFVFNTHPDSFFAQVAICTNAHQTYYGDIQILQNIHYM
jgi:hypothetical protein